MSRYAVMSLRWREVATVRSTARRKAWEDVRAGTWVQPLYHEARRWHGITRWN